MKQTKSTGPRTEEGKKRSSLNALKHGMRAQSPQALEAIEQDMGVSYEDILQDMMAQFRPADALEEYLVKRIARCMWRLTNGESMEMRIRDRRPNAMRPGLSCEKVMRYERLADIHLHRALSALERKQASHTAAKRASQPADTFTLTNELLSEREPSVTSFAPNAGIYSQTRP